MNPKDYIKKNEGLRLFPYRCPSGHLTIGYGRNLDGRGITREEAEILFEDDFRAAESAVRDLVPAFDILSEGRRSALVDMAFNLGKRGFQGFKRMLEAIRVGNFELAASEIENSLYYWQLPDRAKRNQGLIRNG